MWRHGWCVCPEAGLGWTCWQQWQNSTLCIIHQAAASQELHLWSRSSWAHGLSRGCVEHTQWKDETENKTKQIPGQLLSHPPGGGLPLWAPSVDEAPCNGSRGKAGQRVCVNHILNSSFQNCVVQHLLYKPPELGTEISISLRHLRRLGFHETFSLKTKC